MINVGFVTFGDGRRCWRAASERLKIQAHNSGYFHSISSYGLSDIRSKFTEDDRRFIERNSDGFGYFLFKPIAILHFIEKNPEIEVVIYLDAGSEIDATPNKSELFKSYLDSVMKYGYLGFQLENTEENWSKADLTQLLAPPISDLKSGQIAGGHLIFKRDFAIAHCMKWLEIMRMDNYHYLDHSPSKIPNVESFVSHRNDQSISSLLLKKCNYLSVRPASEMEPVPGEINLQKALGPFIAARNSSKFSRLDDNSIRKIKRKLYSFAYNLADLALNRKRFL